VVKTAKINTKFRKPPVVSSTLTADSRSSFKFVSGNRGASTCGGNKCWLQALLIIEGKGKDIGKLDGITISQ
jgi:hypothetical protein